MVTGLQAPIVAGVVSPFAKVVQSPFAGKGFTPSIIARAVGILRSFGADASEYPFSTLRGAYQTSAGPAAVAVNDPIGLELDAMGTVGPELVAVTPVFTSLDAAFVASTTGGTLTAAPTGTLVGYFPSTGPLFVGGETYQITVTLSSYTSGAVALLFFGGGTESQQINGTVTFTVRLDAGATGVAYLYTKAAGTTLTIGSISVREVGGNHAVQTTAGSLPLLAQDVGGRWYANMAGGKSIMATFPAGYESATTIDSTSAGQVTLTGQNLVGTYTINTNTYDRIVIRDSASVSASQLAILQRYSNLLAGL